jgi:hypothetical protein
MATVNKILVGNDDKVVELIGKDKELFLQQRAKDQLESEARKEIEDAQRALKISAYAKLGLTEEEINAIL